MNLNKINNNGKLRIPEAPLMCFLDLTEFCNLQCWFCYKGSKARRGKVDYEDIVYILNEMHKVGCNEVVYIGGEPTLHPQFFEILDYANNLGMIQGIISNGQIIDHSFAKKLIKYKDIEVGISIHSADERVQNAIAGNHKTFFNINRAIESLEAFGICWYSQTSLIKDNYLKLNEIRNYLLSKGNPIRMDLSRMVAGDIVTDKFLDETEYIEIFRQINSMVTKELPIRIEAFPRCWIRKVTEIYKLNYEKIKKTIRPCYAWIAQLSIDIHGNVRLCPTGGKVAGNILKEGMNSIWKNNKSIREFQKFEWQDNRCLKCHDFVYCVGACKMSSNDHSPSSDKYIIKGEICNACIS